VYDVDQEDGRQVPDSEYDSENDTTSMLAIFVTLAQLSGCQKQQKVVPYDKYDLDEENGGEDPGGEYNCE
jgi:hypothetical protein